MSEIDLSAEIAAMLRNPGEQVTCRRVGANHYRCNWWTLRSTSGYDNPGMKGTLITNSVIRQSRFLRAIKTDDTLEITIVGG